MWHLSQMEVAPSSSRTSTSNLICKDRTFQLALYLFSSISEHVLFLDSEQFPSQLLLTQSLTVLQPLPTCLCLVPVLSPGVLLDCSSRAVKLSLVNINPGLNVEGECSGRKGN